MADGRAISPIAAKTAFLEFSAPGGGRRSNRSRVWREVERQSVIHIAASMRTRIRWFALGQTCPRI